MKKISAVRLISFLLACSMLFVLGGCGKSNTTSEYWEEYDEVIPGTEGQVVSGTEGTVTNGSKTKGSVSSVSKEGGYDLKGASITIAMYGEGKQEPQPTSKTYKQEVQKVKDIEAKYNCKIKYLHMADWSEYVSAFNTAGAAGTKFADIVYYNVEWGFPTAVMKNYMTPIDNYYNFDDAILNKNAMNTLSYKGKHYFLILNKRAEVPGVLYYNKALFSRFGVKTPADYVKENNWNWDTFLECAKAMTKESGGVQYYGYALKNGGISTFAGTNTRYTKVDYKTMDKTKLDWDQPYYIEGLQFAWDLYNTYNVTPRDCNDSVNQFRNSTVAMISGAYYEAGDFKTAIGSQNLACTHNPLGPNVKSYSELYSSFPANGWIIPSTVKNPEVVSKIMYDWIYPYTWTQTTSAEESYLSVIGDKQSAKTLKEMTDVASKNIGIPYIWVNTAITWGNYGIQDKIAPQAYIASVLPEAEASLKKMWAGYEP